MLACVTDPRWVDEVLKNFDLFLADHAANERKAAASAMDFVVRYPDRLSLVATAARIAQEEIRHFRMVFDRMKRRGAHLLPDEKDPYARRLQSSVREKGEERLLDRLLVYSLFEFRGIERFELLAAAHPEAEWRKFYEHLAQRERSHGAAFYDEARKIFSEGTVEDRWEILRTAEAEALTQTPVTWRFH